MNESIAIGTKIFNFEPKSGFKTEQGPVHSIHSRFYYFYV